MDAAPISETTEANNVEAAVAEVSEVKVEVLQETNSASELTQSDKTATSDKELSWEKIAAEIAEDEELETKPEENASEETREGGPEPLVEPEPKEELHREKSTEVTTVSEETVIETATEEKTVTEPDANPEVAADSLEKPVEEVAEAAAEPAPVEESAEPVEKRAEPAPGEEPAQDEESAKPGPEPACEDAAATVPTVESMEIQEEEPAETRQPVEEAPVSPAPPVLEKEQAPEKPDGAMIEITELKPEEADEVAETENEIEYTVMETEDVETNEIIEEHMAQSNSNTETIVVINSDQTQTEITIEQMDEGEKSDESSQFTEEIYLVTKESEGSVDDPVEEAEVKVKPKKQRGRKPISDIPLHVLGRDITKPTEGVSNGGRTMPKPRLGVKVPYRNLTSQIVSKEEIEKEIMERFKLKQEQNATTSADILFARKLTQRLAKKLIPSDKEKTVPKPEPGGSVENNKPNIAASEIKNNSDLIAILEGDGDDIDLAKEAREIEKKEAARNSEKEIALQQLKELPGKNRIFKSRTHNEEEKKEEVKPKVVPSPTPQKPAVEKKSQMEMEPRMKTGMVIKTYTRKRKSTDMEPILPPKKSMVAASIKSEDGGPPTDVYITKSSRVIKRKVIWDPDEVPVKSPMKSPKSEPLAKPVAAKAAEKKEQSEKSPEKKVQSEKSQEKKVQGEKSQEKKVQSEKSQEKKIPIPVKKAISKTPPPKKPKRLTEVDRLLMDEGAVNMLYDVKTNDDTVPDKQKKKTNKSVISLDRAHKELMSKTNVIKNDLQQNTNKDVQKSLRKKEVASPPKKESPSPKKDAATPGAVTRKKSKDSVRSSVHSPPASPPYNAAEASRIIRRHSSSSFSSNEEMDEEDGEERVTRKRSATAESSKKKAKKSETKPSKEVAKNNNNTVTEAKANHVDKTVGQHKTFTATKKNKLVSIKLTSVESRCYLTDEVLKELTGYLKEAAKDDDCHVVSVTSDSSESFCDGLDYRLLIGDDDAARRKRATEMASLVKEFLRCLLNFPKVLVAGIQGDCVGLGVTMLPLFDMVIASDTSTFSAPYARLGCVPEAGFLLTVPHLSSNGLASELLYTSQSVKADDAFRRGLVTRLCWPEKYHQELKAMLTQVAGQSRESMVATKQQLRQHVLEETEAALSSVGKVLVEHWTSAECQKNFSK
jgi:chromodomain protein Y